MTAMLRRLILKRFRSLRSTTVDSPTFLCPLPLFPKLVDSFGRSMDGLGVELPAWPPCAWHQRRS